MDIGMTLLLGLIWVGMVLALLFFVYICVLEPIFSMFAKRFPKEFKGELLFTSDGTAITITGSDGKPTGDLIIPATINNLPVISIGVKAFADCTSLTSVTIPNSVSWIGWCAFASCTGLTSVTLPSSITDIGNYAFGGCSGLTSFTLPSSLTSIGEGAFGHCTGLTSVYFMGNAPTHGADLFRHGAPNVTVYYIAGKMGWGTSFGGYRTALWSIPR